MPRVVYCDNKDCHFYDDKREYCDADKLVIKRGICAGSKLHGRNTSENDLDEQLKTKNRELKVENTKLREDIDRFIQAIEDLHNVKLEDELVQLENENDKLRRLLQISLAYCANLYCEEEDGCPLRENQNACRMYVEARKLGIEV